MLLLLAQGALGAAQDKAFFWEVLGKNATVYLLGSVHFANPDFYPLNAGIERAFAESDNLVVEVDIASPGARAAQLIMAWGSYPPGESIEDHLSPRTYQQLSEYLASQQLPVQLIGERGIVALLKNAGYRVRRL